MTTDRTALMAALLTGAAADAHTEAHADQLVGRAAYMAELILAPPPSPPHPVPPIPGPFEGREVAQLRAPDDDPLYRAPQYARLGARIQELNLRGISAEELAPRLSLLRAGRATPVPVRALRRAASGYVSRTSRGVYPPLSEKSSAALLDQLEGL